MRSVDAELNFSEAQEVIDPLPLAAPRPAPVDDGGGDQVITVGVLAFSIAVLVCLVILGLHSLQHSQQHTQSSQEVQQPSVQQPLQPEYFPPGWQYFQVNAPTMMYKERLVYMIPQGSIFFLSFRTMQGFHLAVAEDGSWYGWVTLSPGIARCIPMHPDFAGARKVVEGIDWAALQEQAEEAVRQSSPPEYFPAGWAYVQLSAPASLYMESQTYTIPRDCRLFVSIRDFDGFHMAVAEDGSWSGWINVTGPERQIPMQPRFERARTFVNTFNWDFFESSYSIDTPSQEEDETDPGALGASEVEP